MDSNTNNGTKSKSRNQRHRTCRLLNVCILVFAPLAFFSHLAAAQANTSSPLRQNATPSHVHQVAATVISEILHWRTQTGVVQEMRAPSAQSGKNPFQVYAKGVEALEKISWVQQQIKMDPIVEIPSIPLRSITPNDVYTIIGTILREINRTKIHLGISPLSQSADFVSNRTPSQVFERMWQISSLLDVLVGSVQPNRVLRNLRAVRFDIGRIAAHQNITINVKDSTLPENKTSLHVNLEAYKSMYRLASVQDMLGMVQLRVMDFPTGEILPADVYESSNTLLAEIARLKVHLGIRDEAHFEASEEGVTPNHVWVEMRAVFDSLSILAKKDN